MYFNIICIPRTPEDFAYVEKLTRVSGLAYQYAEEHGISVPAAFEILLKKED